jgi:hypothetical protein
MAFPNLVLRPGGVLWSVATGVPVNGANTFSTGLSEKITQTNFNPNWIFITVEAGGASVTGVSFVSFSLDNSQVTLNFVQSGVDPATVELRLIHTMVR